MLNKAYFINYNLLDNLKTFNNKKKNQILNLNFFIK